MRRFGHTCVAAALAATCVLLPARAHAQQPSSAVAQALFDDALELMEKGQFAEACPKLAESQRLDPAGGTLLNLGSCLERLGRFASAYATYNEALSVAIRDGRSEREAAARERLTELRSRLSHLVVRVPRPTPQLELRFDGVALSSIAWGTSLPVDPGQHTIRASAPGFRSWEQTLLIADDTASSVIDVPALEREELPAPAKMPTPAPSSSDRSSQKTIGWIVGGTGVALLGAGAVTGLLAFSKKAESDAACPTPSTCSDAGVRAMDASETLAWTANITLGLGVIATAAGIVLAATAPRDPSSGTSGSSIRIRPSASGIMGTF